MGLTPQQSWKTNRPSELAVLKARPSDRRDIPHKAAPRSPRTPPTEHLLGGPVLLSTHRILHMPTNYFLKTLRTKNLKSFCTSQSHRNTQKSPQSQLCCREKKNLQTLRASPGFCGYVSARNPPKTPPMTSPLGEHVRRAPPAAHVHAANPVPVTGLCRSCASRRRDFDRNRQQHGKQASPSTTVAARDRTSH